MKGGKRGDKRPFAAILPHLLPQDLLFKPDDAAMAAMGRYVDMVWEWNRAMNLVGAASREDIFARLVCDSLYLADFLRSLPLDLTARDVVLDLGSGAGLPGVPLRAVWHDGEYVMIELRQKRALFLQNVLASLRLPSTRAINADAIGYISQEKLENCVSCIISRAFRPWMQLLAMCRPCLKTTGLQIILANQPPPQLPPGWRLAAARDYPAAGKRRWFWALNPD